MAVHHIGSHEVKRYVPFFFLLTLVLSACTIRLDVDLVVNEDESGSFALFMGFDEEFQELMEQGGGEEMNITEALGSAPEGWTVEEVTEDGFEGMRISTDYSSFEDLEAKLGGLGEGTDVGVGGDFLSDFGLTREGDEFRFEADSSGVSDGIGDALSQSDGGDMMSGMDMSSLLGDLFEIRFNLTLPGSIGANNATSVNGNTLTWEVDLTDEGGTFEAVSTVGGGSSAMLLGGAAVAAAVVAGIGVAAMRRRKTNAAAAAVAAAPVDPVS